MYMDPLCDDVLVALRQIMRAIELQSRKLVRSAGLTGPQLLLLKQLQKEGETLVTNLARRVSLSQATVTDILKRLEARGMVTRKRSQLDRRCVFVGVTDKARELMQSSPPLLQEDFIRQFQNLPAWEQHLLLASLQRIVSMMHARGIDASPVLSSGPIMTSTGIPEVLPEHAHTTDGDGNHAA